MLFAKATEFLKNCSWLAGILLIGENLVISRLAYRRWMYGMVIALFLTFHNLHAALIFQRQ